MQPDDRMDADPLVTLDGGGPAAPEAAGIWTRWLAAEVLEDQHARLEQAGSTPDAAIPLAKVFIDVAATLAASGASPDEPDEEGPDGGALPPSGETSPAPGLLSKLLAVRPAPRRDRADGLQSPRSPMGGRVLRAPPERPEHLVIIGGPGQGKSTLVQHLCQLHRAELLRARVDLLPAPQREAVGLVLEQAGKDGLPRPAVACLPVRVILRDFAAWMVRGNVEPGDAIVRFTAERMSRRLELKIDPEMVRAALARIPLLLVLDGLDEVPASAGRAGVLDALQTFLEGLPADARRLVVATTRPQGYSGELGDFGAVRLLGLSRARALTYGARLAEARYRGQTARQGEIVERLSAAWEEATSRRLMRTPLQVSILAALVAQVGRAPADRWRLFSDYYRVMYQREVERPNLAQAELLRKLRRQIDEVHRIAGLWLQTRSEQAGETEALLSTEELARLIDTVLERNGHDEAEERRALTEQLFEAAVERLVFLVHAREGRYGFEIRSLQELMTAEALLGGGDAEVTRRLRHIAPLDAWRNVFLFAAGKCFAETWHLAPVIVGEICPWLNDDHEDPAVTRSLTGSALALDLIEDGAARNQPRLAKSLAALAVRLLELPPSAVHGQLALVGHLELDRALRRAVEERLALSEPGDRLSAWVVLAVLADAGVDWAEEEANRRWPQDGQGRRDIVEAIVEASMTAGRWLQARIAEALGDFPPKLMRRVALDGSPEMPLAWLAGARPDDEAIEVKDHYPLLVQGRSTGVEVDVSWLLWSPWTLRAFLTMRDPPPAWLPLAVAARFVESPTATTLAQGLDALADAPAPEEWSALRWELPVPLSQALSEARSPAALRALAGRLRSGECGDMADWRAAEKQWQRGIALESLLALEDSWPSEQAPARSFPVDAAWVSWPSNVPWDRSFLDMAVAAYREASDGRRALRGRVVKLFLNQLWGLGRDRAAPGALGPDELRAIWTDTGEVPLPSAVCSLISESASLEPWMALLENVGRAVSTEGLLFLKPHDVDRIVQWHVRFPSTTGLLRLLARSETQWFKRGPVPGSLDAIDPARYPAGSPAMFHATLLRLLASSGETEISSHIAAMADSVPLDPAEARMATSYFGTSFSGEPLATPVQLADWLARLPARAWRLRCSALEALRAHRARQASHLEDPTVWARLDLPQPAPVKRVSSRPPPQPIHAQIDAVRIEGIRAFDSIDLPIVAGQDHAVSGRWITLLGENGTGKTTLLRALALALTDPSLAATIVKAGTAPYLSHDGAQGLVRLGASGRTFFARISRSTTGGEELSESPAGERPLLFAYGCRRGSALGGVARAVSFRPYDAIATLFEEGAGLIHAETWLKERALAAKEKDAAAARALFEAIRQALVRILPGVKRIDVKAEGVWIEGPAVGRTTLEGLSDGYLSTMGWIVDLLARWLDHKERAKEAVGPDLFAEMEGIVLVDEIDLHLHPRWQLRVIDDVRTLFPRMTFVVTTHNPLTLLGARPGEVIVLRRSEVEIEGDDTSAPVSPRERTRIEAFQQDLPPGITVDQMLTGAWFGLASTLDKDTLRLLEQHRTLLREGAGRDDPRRLSLEAELRRRLGGFADTSLERLAQSVAAEVLPERAPLGPEQRERLRRRILETVAAEALSVGERASSPTGARG